MTTVQRTLTGRRAEADRKRPSTFLQCPDCGEPVLRSRTDDHEHSFDGAMAFEKAKRAALEEKVPDHAQLETQTFVVTLHCTAVERVKVEATDPRDAKREAEHYRTYDVEIEDTVHTDTTPDGDDVLCSNPVGPSRRYDLGLAEPDDTVICGRCAQASQWSADYSEDVVAGFLLALREVLKRHDQLLWRAERFIEYPRPTPVESHKYAEGFVDPLPGATP